MDTLAIFLFFDKFFFNIFMVTIFGIPIGQPQVFLFKSRWFVVFICVYSCGLPTWRLIPDQFKWCNGAAANVAFVVSVIIDIVLYPAVVLHQMPVPAFG